MIKRLAIYICMFLVGMMGFFGISHNSPYDTNSLVLGTSVFADGCAGPHPPVPCLGAANGQNTSQSADMQKTMNNFIN